jgi:DNA primase
MSKSETVLELRVDLDPEPEASWDDVRQVALVAKAVLEDNGLVGFPKTSGSRHPHQRAAALGVGQTEFRMTPCGLVRNSAD